VRILHINDEAGVACILAKYQQKLLGYESKVIKLNRHDKYGIYHFYKDYVTTVASEEQFIKNCVDEARHADLIHVHGRDDVVLLLRHKFGESKKIVLHYHGTDLRGIDKQKLPHRSKISDTAIKFIWAYRKMRNILLLAKRKKRRAQSLANIILVSTIDLIGYIRPSLSNKVTYFPNPVDIDHFKPNMKEVSDSDLNSTTRRFLTIDNEATDMRLTLDHLKQAHFDIDIHIHNRMKSPVVYGDMPKFLKQYSTYVDIRYVNNKIIPTLSKTALEALACGLSVLDHELKYVRSLPEEHYPNNIIPRLSETYYKAI
jgi:glycosyltransferase involved in cell wall biosynthesis